MPKSVKRVIYLDGESAKGSLKELQAESRKLRSALRNLNPSDKDFKDINKRYLSVRNEIKGINTTLFKSQGLVQKFKKGFSEVLFPVSGALLFTQALSSGVRFAREFIVESRELALEAKGVEFAFEALGDRGEDAFNRIKLSTRGLLSDIDIKKSIVEFDNFNLSLEESDTLFEFLSIRAAQTGKSIDSLRDSLVEGLSKESKLRIDNLGISALELNEQLEKSPTFIDAVATIAKREIAEAGSILDDAANSQTKWNATLENSKLRLGRLILDSGAVEFFQDLGSSILETVLPLEDSVDKFKSQRAQVNLLEKETQPLIDRYKELSEKTSLSNTEQSELNSLIQAITTRIPLAATGFDEYGKALGLSTVKAEDFIKQQRAMLAITNKDAIEDTREQIGEVEKDISRLTEILNEYADGEYLTPSGRVVEVTTEQIENLQSQLQKAQDEKLGLDGILQELTGIIEGVEEGGKKVVDKIVNIKKATLKELEALGTEDAKAEIKRRKEVADEQKKIADANIKAVMEIEDLRIQIIEDEQKREQEKLKNTLERKKKEVDNSKASEQNKNELKKSLDKKYISDKQKIDDKYLKEKNDKEQKALLDNLELELNNAKDGSKEKLVALQNYLDKKLELELANEQLTFEQKELLRQNYEQLKIDAKTEQDDLLKQKEEEKDLDDLAKAELAVDAAIDISNAFLEIRANRDQEEIKKNEAKSQADIKLLKQELDSKLKNENLSKQQREKLEEEYATKVDAINKDLDRKNAAIKEEAWKRERKAALITVIIQTALAVTKALPNLFLATAAGIAGAAQGVIIANQPIPEFAEGGSTFQHGGHVGKATLGLIGEAGAEYVIPNWMLQKPEIADIVGALEGMRINKFAEGGSTDINNTIVEPVIPQAESQETDRLANIMELLVDTLQTPIRAVYDQSEVLNIKDQIQEFNDIENNAQI